MKENDDDDVDNDDVDNDDDDVARNNKQLIKPPKIPAEFTYYVYKPFSDYQTLKYGEYEDEKANRNRQKDLDYVFSLGVEKAKEKLEFEIYPILWDGHKPRKDVLIKLVRIVKEFQSYPEYPKIKSMNVTKTINKIIDSMCDRTKEKYHNCVHQYLTKPGEFGIADVSEFVERLSNEYLDTTSSTSSFREDEKHE